MKRGIRISIVAFVLVGTLAALALLAHGMDKEHKMKTCEGLDVAMVDSTRVSFIDARTVKGIMDSEYGVYLGKPLDSLDLRRIETLMLEHGVIRSAEAYVTPDGKLHIDITQREPALLLKSGSSSWYCDASGYIFPMLQGYGRTVPVVKGSIPIALSDGFTGIPAAENEQAWLSNVQGLAGLLSSDPKWRGAFPVIDVGKGGDIELHPSKGKEKFIFGSPEGYKAKVEAMQKYYTHIAPAKGAYATVNLKYEGQIICRNK